MCMNMGILSGTLYIPTEIQLMGAVKNEEGADTNAHIQKSCDWVGCTHSDGGHQLQQHPGISLSLLYTSGTKR